MPPTIKNKTIDTLRIGDYARVRRRFSRADIGTFIAFTAHVLDEGIDRELAADASFRAAIAAGGSAVTLLCALIAARLPGPGCKITQMHLDFAHPLRHGDEAILQVTVAAIDQATATVTLDLGCLLADETPVLSGQVTAIAPKTPISRPFGRAVALDSDTAPDRLTGIEARAKKVPSVRMAVVNPVDAASLIGARDSAEAGLITPILIGPTAQIRATAAASGLDLSSFDLIECHDAHAAAEKAAALAVDGACDAIMKGVIHTDILLRAVLHHAGLRTDRRLSHVFVEDVPRYPRLLFVADAAVNISPDLATLRDIVQNTVDLAHALGIVRPKVAMLSAVETVTSDIPSTIAAAAICKMADRGEITGADIDGPLALDNAVSEQAARMKGITSPVAGRADILIAPNIEAANILAKDLDYLAAAEAAGIALGARVPIALTSRADTPRERRASAALAAIMVDADKRKREAKS